MTKKRTHKRHRMQRNTKKKQKTQKKQRMKKMQFTSPLLPNQVAVFQKYVPKKEITSDANNENDGNMIPGMRNLLLK